MIGSDGVKGAWAASIAYGIGDLVESSQATYLCHTAHTSGSSLTAAEIGSYWILLANAAILATASAVDKLNGDGSLTAFTLSENNPSGDTDVLVFVNGSLQTPTSDYTISGTTLTFSTAPSSGTNNVIAWGTSTVVEAAKTVAQSARDTALAHRDDASQHKTTAERWAKLEDATVVDVDTSVDSGEYSAKEYAVGDTVTIGSAKEWASKAYNSAVVTSPSNEYSAKHYAQNIQEWATKDDGAVSGAITPLRPTPVSKGPTRPRRGVQRSGQLHSSAAFPSATSISSQTQTLQEVAEPINALVGSRNSTSQPPSQAEVALQPLPASSFAIPAKRPLRAVSGCLEGE